jgi:mannose-6-phosphate isomerase
MSLYPLILNPAYKDYIWGGSRIPSLFQRDAPPGACAESWEISDRPEGMSVVANGPLQGATLQQLVATYGHEITGFACCTPGFPLLVKLIDARDRLSIQVHPDDEAAARGIGEAKTEAWHILEAPPGAQVFAGLKAGVSESAFMAHLRANTLESCLQAIPVQAGDTIFIPGGRVHAICEGLLILEVQQNSDTTYRVYDWGRVGKDGKPRDLHVEQALKVIRWHDPEPAKTAPGSISTGPGMTAVELVTSPYFRLERLVLEGPCAVRHDGSGFHALFSPRDDLIVLAGGMAVAVPRGRTCLIPAQVTPYTVKPAASSAQVLRITGPSGASQATAKGHRDL